MIIVIMIVQILPSMQLHESEDSTTDYVPIFF